MPGYLSHLAARVLGAKPAVRPRLPSIFEPAPSTTLSSAPDTGGLHVVEQERVVSQPSVPRPALSTIPTEPPVPAPAVTPSRSFERQITPAIVHRDASIEDVIPDRAALQHSPRHQQRVDSTVVRDTAAPLHEIVPPRIERPATEPLEQPRLTDSEPVPRVARVEQEPPRTAPVETPEHLQRNAVSHEPRSERRPQELDRVPVAALPTQQATTFAPKIETQPAERFQTFAESSDRQQPSVQITIGRLIVEAHTPAPATAQPPAPRPHPPRLSLDDYLRQRRSQA